MLREVLRHREGGLSLAAAIQRARAGGVRDERSVFAGLRRRRPELQAHLLPRRALVALAHAIEDECCARAERPILFGAFQRERFYRRSEKRWRDLARGARMAVVMADFAGVTEPPDAPAEVPFAREDPLAREWVVICDGPAYAACLAARERPGAVPGDAERRFETLWTVDPPAVRDASRMAAGWVAGAVPHRVAAVADLLAQSPPPADGSDLRHVTALTGRMIDYVTS